MLLLVILPLVAAVEFRKYELHDPYKCNSFVADQLNEPVMSHFYSKINGFIQLLSKRLDHDHMFDEDEIKEVAKKMADGSVGRTLEEVGALVVESGRRRYTEFIDHDQGWLALAGSLVLFAAFFTFIYLIYCCWVCCCCRRDKKDTMDGKSDSCKRSLLNFTIGIFVFINVFSVATLLISSQYAQYGADELPHRLGQCLDDLSLYKRDTEARFKHLLIDNYNDLNNSLVERVTRAGDTIVQKVKKLSGAQTLDLLVDMTNTARSIMNLSDEVLREVRLLNDDLLKFRSDYTKLQKASDPELLNCIQHVNEPGKSICQRTIKVLSDLGNFSNMLDGKIVSDETYGYLRNISGENLPQLFEDVNGSFADIAKDVQAQCNRSKNELTSKLTEVEQRVFHEAEMISAQIRRIPIDYEFLNKFTDKNSEYRKYVRYCWYGSLVISGIFALVALYFLFAWCYGCFGRRPTYYEDDCCVRTTGGKLFTCGIWLSLFLLIFLSFITAVLLLIGGNVSNLICHPLREPLNRKDILSFGDRLIKVHREEKKAGGESSVFGNVTLSAFIQACERNETLYTIFELEERYHLSDLRNTNDADFHALDDAITKAFERMNINGTLKDLLTKEKIEKINTVEESVLAASRSNGLNTTKFEEQVRNFDFADRHKAFLEGIENEVNLPKAVTDVIARLKSKEIMSAHQLQNRMEMLLSNVTTAGQSLANISAPVGNIVQKLQHAQALLEKNLTDLFLDAAKDVAETLRTEVNQYVELLHTAVTSDATSCAPLVEIVRGSRAALCSYTVDPFNGIWASMLISILCIVPIIICATAVKPLYRKMHAYPKYVVHEPVDGSQMNAFVTDTYDIRSKQPYYSSGSSSEEYPPPYMRNR